MYNGEHFFRLVTLKIPGIAGTGNVGTQFAFPDQSDIRYARIIALETFFASDLAFAQPEAVAIIPDNKANLLTLVLEANDPDKDLQGNDGHGRYSNTTQVIKWIPVTSLHRLQNAGLAAGAASSFVRQLLPYYDLNITWEKSFLNVAPGGLANTTDLGFVLGVHYTFRDIDGKLRKRT